MCNTLNLDLWLGSTLETRLMRVIVDSVFLRMRVKVIASGLDLGTRISLGNSREIHRVLDDRSSNSLAVDQERLKRKVVVVVAHKMVVRIVRHTCLSAPPSCLFLSLDGLCAGEDTSSRDIDTFGDERTIVGSSVEFGVLGRNVSFSEPILEEMFDVVTPSWARDVEL